MAVLRVGPLPEGALEAAELFHKEVLPRVRSMLALNPPRHGEVAARSADGGGPRPDATSPENAPPLHHPASGPPPLLSLSKGGEDLVLIFPPAPHDHRGWRLAVVQGLARTAAPVRVNGIVGDDEGAISEALAYLEDAPGVTGQLLAVEPG